MHVHRIGFTPLKGARHTAHSAATLAPEGPVGDRRYCLVDPSRNRVLRTVENPSMLETTATVDGDQLRVDLPHGAVAGVPQPTGELRAVDYWGREVQVELLDGPWSDAYTAHLGYGVRLARPSCDGAVVYAGSVTLVTTSSMALAADRIGRPVAGERFRSTFLIDTGDLPAHVEDTWTGRELRLGEAVVRVRGRVARCAVVDLDPGTGTRDALLLKTLAGYRLHDGEIYFGVDAEVAVPGQVAEDDPVTLRRD